MRTCAVYVYGTAVLVRTTRIGTSLQRAVALIETSLAM